MNFRPLPEIVWTKINDELPLNKIKDLTSQESDYGKSLIIDSVHPDDAGIYECRSQHLFHQMHVTITGSVQVNYVIFTENQLFFFKIIYYILKTRKFI